jgi:hypothetical protein
MAQRTEREWKEPDRRYDTMKRQTGWDTSHIAKEIGLSRQTLVDRLRLRLKQGSLPADVNPWADTPPVHPSVPEPPAIPELVHQSTPERTEPSVHPGTLEGHQEVIEDISESVPDAPHISSEGADQGTAVHLSTPIVHPEVSPDDSALAHPGVPARQAPGISTPMVHPGTPTEEDWLLWTAMKGRWIEIEKMLADWQSRRTLLRTPIGTPRHTMKKTYVVDRLYVELIDRYAQAQGVELKDVVNLAFREFFERREYLPEDTR